MRSDDTAEGQRSDSVVRDNWQHEQASGSVGRHKGDPSSEPTWAPADFPAVILLVVLGAIVLGLLLRPIASGGNMKMHAMLAIVPWAAAVFISARGRRSRWSDWQRRIFHIVLALTVVLVWVAIFTQPRVEGDGTPTSMSSGLKAFVLQQADGSQEAPGRPTRMCRCWSAALGVVRPGMSIVGVTAQPDRR